MPQEIKGRLLIFDDTELVELMRRAFVAGAKWWEYETTKFSMWQSDQNLAWQASESKIGRLIIEFEEEKNHE